MIHPIEVATACDDAASGTPATDAILDNACSVPEGYGYVWVDAEHLVAEWQETTTPIYGWVVDLGPAPASCYVEVVKPTELDAIAARFEDSWSRAAGRK